MTAEKRLGFALPSGMRWFAEKCASEVCIYWSLDETGAKRPDSLNGVTGGGFEFSLAALPGMYAGQVEMTRQVFPNQNDPIDSLWHNTLCFAPVPNGDMLALPRMDAKRDQIVYLSHEGDDDHGWEMGTSFYDSLMRWVSIGCVGPESWQWTPFCSQPHGPIDPAGSMSRAWLQWLQ